MPSWREYPDRPIVGVGGVVIEDSRALLIRRGSEPLRGEWSIPGGILELGETLETGVARELLEETGLRVRVLELIEVFDRIDAIGAPATDRANNDAPSALTGGNAPVIGKKGPRFHYVIADYLCERISGEAAAASDVTDVAWAREDELAKFSLTTTATRVLRKAFALARNRNAQSASSS